MPSLGETDATRARAYRALFQIDLSGADIDPFRETTNKNWVLGNERFKRKIEELAGRRASPARRGPQPASSSANRAWCNAAFRRYGVSNLTPKITRNGLDDRVGIRPLRGRT